MGVKREISTKIERKGQERKMGQGEDMALRDKEREREDAEEKEKKKKIERE